MGGEGTWGAMSPGITECALLALLQQHIHHQAKWLFGLVCEAQTEVEGEAGFITWSPCSFLDTVGSEQPNVLP